PALRARVERPASKSGRRGVQPPVPRRAPLRVEHLPCEVRERRAEPAAAHQRRTGALDFAADGGVLRRGAHVLPRRQAGEPPLSSSLFPRSTASGRTSGADLAASIALAASLAPSDSSTVSCFFAASAGRVFAALSA